ncbi:CYFA0S03e02256g1_1 [Cyberlindnera fabianii]|uniref:CYFA0S03e02256g1_1 n=1 Tax=Cyberlindnera fabianii TaxID=36022 RepID=A0A061AVB8_CYBFA|nr:Protein LTV1 [Cyberlindnera fabianii]CDR39333.1 CYFA0S03e02256g1_1 [Cyberlindnera fabianii]
MSSRKWVDKKTAKTFKVVYRSHDDPLYHDTDASENVLVPVENKKQQLRSQKVKTKAQLEAELGEEIHKMRQHEGESALYGITFDDSKYDYLQHLKPMGQGEGVFIPAAEKKDTKKKGILFKEEDLPEGVLPSKDTVKRTYQDQQNMPDEITGFKPDMNPALREVLEALDDEAYVDDDDAVFEDLLEGGAPVDEREFEDQFDEWDMDNYEEEMAQYDEEHFAKEGDQGWEAGFRKFEAINKYKKNDWDSDDEFDEDDEEEEEEEDEGDVLGELPSLNDTTMKSKKGAKRKERRKKGALSDTSAFSMSSSAMLRSESLRLLDDRFEVLSKRYEGAEDEEEEDYQPFDMQNERADFENLLDEFLDNYETEGGGRRLVKKNDETRKLKEAADSVSRGKLAQKRNKERDQQKKGSSLGGLGSSFSNLKI